jgi:penicillin-binding protein 1A
MRLARKLGRFIWISSVIVLTISLGIGGFAYYIYRGATRDLPPLDKILQYEPSRTSHVYAAAGELIGEFYFENRVPVSLSQIPQHVRDAFLAAEDKNFYQHQGFDWQAIVRALLKNFRAGQVIQGGSTITQQVVKMIIGQKERSYRRKIREAVLAYRLEQKLSKDKILEIYLNEIYLGSGAYGVEAASRVYFGKSVSGLDFAQAAMLAGLSKAPSKDSPRLSPSRARVRQKYVLGRLTDAKKISEAAARLAYEEDIKMPVRPNSKEAPGAYFIEHVRKILVEKYGNDLILRDGLKIYTTLSVRAQRAADDAVKNGLREVRAKWNKPSPIDEADQEELARCLRENTNRQRYSQKEPTAHKQKVRAIILYTREDEFTLCALGRIARLDKSDSEELLAWRGIAGEKIKAMDVVLVDLWTTNAKGGKRQTSARLSQPQKEIEAALLAVDLETGAVRAMVGGSDFQASEFNRALQAKRQIGSGVKALIFAAAIENGWNEMSLVEDAPISVPVIGGAWEPKNYKREFLGPITLRTAFAKSINTVAVRLALALELKTVTDYFRRLGIKSPIPNHISVALGTVDASLLELVNVYATFPRGGTGREPYFIEKVVDARGNVLLENEPVTTSRLSREASYIMVDLLKAVTNFGTGRRAKNFPRPIGGKTGTSTNYNDAWFIGFSTDLIAGVCVGRDDSMPIGHDATGGRAALPIWLDFMQNGHPQTPVRDFEASPGIIFHKVNPETGKIVDDINPYGELIPFMIGNEPESVYNSLK